MNELKGYNIDEETYDINSIQFFLLVNKNFAVQNDKASEEFELICNQIMTNYPLIKNIGKFLSYPAIKILWTHKGNDDFPGFKHSKELKNCIENMEHPSYLNIDNGQK